MTMIEEFTSTSSFLQWTLHDHDRRLLDVNSSIMVMEGPLLKGRGRCNFFYHGHGGSPVKRKR
jgi:hypothetical protein